MLLNDWFVLILLFSLAAAIRWLFVLYNPHEDGFLIYQGNPLSDGCSYTFKAISIAHGHGIPPVQQPAVRPFYPILLACFYTWTGFSLWAVVVLNIIAAAFTTGLIYLCGALALNRFCALGAALFFAIAPSQLIQTPQAGTEPLGLLFFVASVYAILRAFEKRYSWLFFLSGVFIGLSNLTRTLTILTLPLYLALVLWLIGVRERAFKSALIYLVLMLLGFAMVILPWVIRQERMYGISSISDNIGEAFYAATSPNYKQWTPLVRKDADADGVPNAIGDRYRYFMRRAMENVIHDPGFYFRNVGASIWEYANTFNRRSRAAPRYVEEFSRAREDQRVFFIFMVVLLISAFLVRGERFYSRHFLWLASGISLVCVYAILPHWLAFLPIIFGLVLSSKAGRGSANLVIFASLAMAVLGSAIFANSILFRAILMTDWLFIFYFLAGVWFPIESLFNRSLVGSNNVLAGHALEPKGRSQFQSTLFVLSRRLIFLVIAILVGLFAISSVRLFALTLANPARRGERQLTTVEINAVLRRLQGPPFSMLPISDGDLPVSSNAGRGAGRQPGQYVVLVQRFDYDYYIPAGKVPPRSRLPVAKPYAWSLVIVPQFDFTIAGEIPSHFSNQSLIFVGIVADKRVENGGELPRLQVDGLALIPFDQHMRPDYSRAICAPPSPFSPSVRH